MGKIHNSGTVGNINAASSMFADELKDDGRGIFSGPSP
jgi:hypothetical protein